MSVTVDELRSIPLFRDITDDHLQVLIDAFETVQLAVGDVLFEAGTEPTHLYMLVDGEITLRDGTDIEYTLTPPAPIGELGSVTGYIRNTRATATKPSTIWQMERTALMDFFELHGDVAFPFYHNLVNVVSEKIRRDTRRLDEMRANIIRTQKAMKQMRDALFAAEDTALNQSLFETLEGLISQNRRWNYIVEPPSTLGANVRLNDGTVVAVREISGVWLIIPASNSVLIDESGFWSGVLALPKAEIPVSGQAVREGHLVRIELDLLIDEYASVLEDYLTRVQMLDVVV